MFYSINKNEIKLYGNEINVRQELSAKEKDEKIFIDWIKEYLKSAENYYTATMEIKLFSMDMNQIEEILEDEKVYIQFNLNIPYNGAINCLIEKDQEEIEKIEVKMEKGTGKILVNLEEGDYSFVFFDPIKHEEVIKETIVKYDEEEEPYEKIIEKKIEKNYVILQKEKKYDIRVLSNNNQFFIKKYH